MTKHIIQLVNLDVVIGNGCSRTVSKEVESLVFLQTSHAAVNLLTEAYNLVTNNMLKRNK